MTESIPTPAIDISQTNSTTDCSAAITTNYFIQLPDDPAQRLDLFINIIFNGTYPSLRMIAEHPKAKAKIEALEMQGALPDLCGHAIGQVVQLPEAGSMDPDMRREFIGELNRNGFAIYYNSSEYRRSEAGEIKETSENIHKFNVLVVDMDGEPVDKLEQWCAANGFMWSAKVQTSAGKYQYIWKLKKVLRGDSIGYTNGEPDAEWITVEQYKDISIVLAANFGGDRNVCKPTQIFRLPSYRHWKAGGEGRPVVLESLNKNEYKWADVVRAVSTLVTVRTYDSAGLAGQGIERNDRNRMLREAARENRVSLQAVEFGMIRVGAGDRHDVVLREATKLAHEGLTREEITIKIDKIISDNYEDCTTFLSGGSRRREVERAISCALEYRELNNRREIQASLNESIVPSVAATAVTGAGVDGGGSSQDSYSDTVDSYDFNAKRFGQSLYSEVAIAERVFQRHGPKLIRVGANVYGFNEITGTWILQGAKEDTGLIQLWTMDVIQDMVCEQKFLGTMCCDSKGNFNADKRRGLVNAYLSGRTIRSVCGLALSHTGIKSESPSIFDNQPHMLSVMAEVDDGGAADGEAGGGERRVKIVRRALNMRTLELRPIRSSDYLLYSTDVIWRGIDTPCGDWLVFLREVFADNVQPEAMCKFMQEVFGYTLSGGTGEQKLFCHYGDGANGKSKVMEGLKRIVGQYGTLLGADELLVGKGFKKSFERTGAKVEGRRCVIIDDIDVGGTWNEGFVKTLTGMHYEARAEFQRTRTAVNRAKFHLGMNRLPLPEAENYGLLRRVCIIRYQRTFVPNSAKERELADMLKREDSGILAWAVAGYRAIMDTGLTYPEETLEEIEIYKDEVFTIENIIKALIRPCTAGETPTRVFIPDLVDAINSRIPAGEPKVDSRNVTARVRTRWGFNTSGKAWCKERQNAFRYIDCTVLAPLKKELASL